MTVFSTADCRVLTDLEAQVINGGVARPNALYPVATGGGMNYGQYKTTTSPATDPNPASAYTVNGAPANYGQAKKV